MAAEYKNMLEKSIRKNELDQREAQINSELHLAHVTHNTRAINELERQKDALALERQLMENLY